MTTIGAASGLLTDLYELTMAAGYLRKHMPAVATFELFVRKLPPARNYLVAAGLEQALDFLERVRFSEQDIAYLRGLATFRHVDTRFFDYLREFRFRGEVWAMPEGTIFFPGEPVLRVTAPIAEAQIVETALLSTVHFQTLIASKAARVTKAAEGRMVIEFGSRRAHGTEASVLGARAAFIGGCAGTSNAYAGQRFGIPVHGTQAHSWIMAHEDEAEAFGEFLEVFPEEATLLVDTYDARAALEKIIGRGKKPAGIRLDSGDLLADSRWARVRLDEAGWNGVKIFASGDLDEGRIAELLRGGARIDGFGVGTALSTSSDAPHLSVIYKLAEVAEGGESRMTAKYSEHKKTYPGRKQVWRARDARGRYRGDTIALEEERVSEGEPLLELVMREGKRAGPAASRDSQARLREAQERFHKQRERLPEAVCGLEPAEEAYPVLYSERLERLSEEMRQSLVRATAP